LRHHLDPLDAAALPRRSDDESVLEISDPNIVRVLRGNHAVGLGDQRAPVRADRHADPDVRARRAGPVRAVREQGAVQPAQGSAAQRRQAGGSEFVLLGSMMNKEAGLADRGYFGSILQSARSVLDGMAVTFSYMFRKPTTIQYPDRVPVPVPE